MIASWTRTTGTSTTGLRSLQPIRQHRKRQPKGLSKTRLCRLTRNIFHLPTLHRRKRQMLGGKVLLVVESGRKRSVPSSLLTGQFRQGGGIVRFCGCYGSMSELVARVVFWKTSRSRPVAAVWEGCQSWVALLSSVSGDGSHQLVSQQQGSVQIPIVYMLYFVRKFTIYGRCTKDMLDNRRSIRPRYDSCTFDHVILTIAFNKLRRQRGGSAG